MKSLYKFKFDCYRSGKLLGLFIADSEDVNKLIESGKSIYFGEVLGKHSVIQGPIEKNDVIFVTDKPEIIKMVEELNLCFGYNPFNYLNNEENEE